MIRIVTDSVAGLPAQFAREHDIQVVSLFVNYHGQEFVENEMNIDEFYGTIDQMIHDIPTSSQPSQEQFMRVFTEIAQAGDQLLGVFVSSGLSGTYEGALRAAREVNASHANFQYALIDSTSCSYDESWPLLRGVAARDAGASLEICAQEVVSGIQSTRFLFVPDSLTFLHKGGRIGNAAAFIGGLVKITPVLTVKDGLAHVCAKVRTRNKAMSTMFSHFKNDVDTYGIRNVMVHYIGDKNPAIQWAHDVVEPFLNKNVQVTPVSPVVGVHVGPAVGIAYECIEKLHDKVTKPSSSLICSA